MRPPSIPRVKAKRIVVHAVHDLLYRNLCNGEREGHMKPPPTDADGSCGNWMLGCVRKHRSVTCRKCLDVLNGRVPR